MQRELLGVLYQMSKTEEGCARIEGIELGGALQRALRSPHPSVVRTLISYRVNVKYGICLELSAVCNSHISIRLIIGIC